MKRAYEIFADLLEYPTTDWHSHYEELSALLECGSKSYFAPFELFVREADRVSLSDLQELYTRTFDLNPVCALDIGYHLFGENYKRGVFLANLRQTESPFELGQEHQLPDYLPVLLRLIATLDDEELRRSLIEECMIPALTKMLSALVAVENPYRHLLESVSVMLRTEVGVDLNEPASRALYERASLPVIQSEMFGVQPLDWRLDNATSESLNSEYDLMVEHQTLDLLTQQKG